jgi:hypothetical protein
MFESGNSGSDEDRPGAEEIYERATNTSNLKQLAERRTSADVLRDMAMSADRLGAALLRLRGQWEASEKPNRPTKESIKALVGTYQQQIPGEPPRAPGEKRMPLTVAQAHTYATAWYWQETSALVGRLEELPTVREQLMMQALKWGMGRSDDPVTRSDLTQLREQDAALLAKYRGAVEAAEGDAAKMTAQAVLNSIITEVEARRREEREAEVERARTKAAEVIRYWLDQTCQGCDGRRWQTIPGSPGLSNKVCHVCGGTGIAPVPHQQHGRKLANHMDQCVHRYRQLSQTRKAMIGLPLSERIPFGMRHGQNPKPLKSDPDPEAD